MMFEPGATGSEVAADIVRRALAILDEEVRAWLGAAAPAEEILPPETPALPEGDDRP